MQNKRSLEISIELSEYKNLGASKLDQITLAIRGQKRVDNVKRGLAPTTFLVTLDVTGLNENQRSRLKSSVNNVVSTAIRQHFEGNQTTDQSAGTSAIAVHAHPSDR